MVVYLDDDDVIEVNNALRTCSGWRLNIVKDGWHNLLAAKVLRASGGGWQKGKVKISFEFIPDTPPPLLPPEGDAWEETPPS